MRAVGRRQVAQDRRRRADRVQIVGRRARRSSGLRCSSDADAASAARAASCAARDRLPRADVRAARSSRGTARGCAPGTMISASDGSSDGACGACAIRRSRLSMVSSVIDLSLSRSDSTRQPSSELAADDVVAARGQVDHALEAAVGNLQTMDRASRAARADARRPRAAARRRCATSTSPAADAGQRDATTTSARSSSTMSIGGSQHGPPRAGESVKNCRCIRSASRSMSIASASKPNPGSRDAMVVEAPEIVQSTERGQRNW